MKKTNNDQIVMDKGSNARVEVNINTNEPKKKGGFKRGAVVGTLGGIFLGGVGAAYAIENEITINDVKEGINDIMEDVNRGIEAATNGGSTSEEATTNSADEVVTKGAEETTNETSATEDKCLTSDEVVDALKGATADDITDDQADGDAVIDTPEMTVYIDESVSIAENVNDDMSFDEAFAAARAEVGAGGAFEWRGGVYGTYYAEEWESMSAEEKAEFGDQFEFVAAEDDEFEPIDVTVDELLAAEDEVVAVPEPAVDPEPEIEVEVDNVYNVTDAHGNESAYVEVSVDGEEVQLIDENGDGVIDVMVYDENGDGVIDDVEMVNVSEEGLMVDDFRAMVEEPSFEEPLMDEPCDDVVADDAVM